MILMFNDLTHLFSYFMFINNNIRNDSARSITEALKVNQSITNIDLLSMILVFDYLTNLFIFLFG